MKLRILSNSLRLRLTQSEVQSIEQGGAVEARTNFPDGQSLHYRISSSTGDEIVASFSDQIIQVLVPADMLLKWARGTEVSLRSKLVPEDSEKLSILIEKDFKCLTERAEDESDLFPNPNDKC